jgi:hypothetical protein
MNNDSLQKSNIFCSNSRIINNLRAVLFFCNLATKKCIKTYGPAIVNNL